MIRCLSVRQPWVWAIIHAGKDIENRSWSTKLRGRVLIHASKGHTREEYEVAQYDIRVATGGKLAPPRDLLQYGGIIGSVEIVDCLGGCVVSDSCWAIPGQFHLVLRDPKPLPFTPCKGQLGFFQAPWHVARILEQRGAL